MRRRKWDEMDAGVQCSAGSVVGEQQEREGDRSEGERERGKDREADQTWVLILDTLGCTLAKQGEGGISGSETFLKSFFYFYCCGCLFVRLLFFFPPLDAN